MSYDFDLFVIGGGSGGVRCARIAAGLGAKVGIAEHRFWGGTCVNVGCVPKKLMVMAAEYGNTAADASGFGWGIMPAEHNWQALIEAKNVEIGRLNSIYSRLLAGSGVAEFNAFARFTGPHTLDVGGKTITAERIVIATGGKPAAPEFPGAEHCIISDDAFFLPKRPNRIALLGGGYIAVEFAGVFAGLGSEVDLVMRQPLPLRGFDEDLRTSLAEALTANGVRVHGGSAVVKVTEAGGSKTIHLSNGETIQTDLVFAALGRTPAVEGLGLDSAGGRAERQGGHCGG